MRLHLERFIDRARFNVFKDDIFDTRVAQQLGKINKNGSQVMAWDDKKKLDLFVVWANYAQKSIPVARKHGAKIILESGSCHIKTQQKLLETEYARWGVNFKPIDQRTIDKMCAEYEAADYIMTLSSFARQSFIDQGVPAGKVLMVPCGVDLVKNGNLGIYAKPFETVLRTSSGRAQTQSPLVLRSDSTNRVSKDLMKTPKAPEKFRVIFVGLVTLRKGVQYLIEAWDAANLPQANTELIIVGNEQKDFLSIKAQLPITSNIIFAGSMSKTKLNELYASSSLFVLPSIEDGFGMVIGEAMGHGMPVICSTNTAGPDLITDGIEGWVVPPADKIALSEKIAWCYSNQDKAAQMGLSAQQKIQSFNWDTYGARVWEVYKKLV